MQEIQTVVVNGAVAILTILVGILVKSVKEYLAKKGGEKAIRMIEIIAQNVVRAVEQMSADKEIRGKEKFEIAKGKVQTELARYNIEMTDSQLNTFIESAVKAMNEGWQ